jgi:hypothetical protein
MATGWDHYDFMETLKVVRFRLDELVKARSVEAFGSSEAFEYHVLTDLEATLLGV